MKRCLIAANMFILAGCYTPNNEKFRNHINSLVVPDAPLDVSLTALRREGFICDPMPPMPSKTCSRSRQLPLPAACMERVNLYATESGRITRIEIPKIACTGL